MRKIIWLLMVITFIGMESAYASRVPVDKNTLHRMNKMLSTTQEQQLNDKGVRVVRDGHSELQEIRTGWDNPVVRLGSDAVGRGVITEDVVETPEKLASNTRLYGKEAEVAVKVSSILFIRMSGRPSQEKWKF